MKIEKSIIIIGILAVFAVVLTVLREKLINPGNSSKTEASVPSVPRASITPVVDTILRWFGAVRIQRSRTKITGSETARTDVKVFTSREIDPIKLLSALKDSMRQFGVGVVAIESLREKTTRIHLLHHQNVIESLTIFKEVQKKGVVPSQSKKQKAVLRKARR